MARQAKLADIVFLQETYSTEEVEAIWKTQYKGKMFFYHGTNPSCVVLVLVKDDLELNRPQWTLMVDIF